MCIRPYAFICNRFITDIRWYVSLIIAINRLINTIPVRRRYVAMINLTHDSTHESTFFVICKSSGRVNPKRAKNNISNALIGLASSVMNKITITPLKRSCTHIKNVWPRCQIIIHRCLHPASSSSIIWLAMSRSLVNSIDGLYGWLTAITNIEYPTRKRVKMTINFMASPTRLTMIMAQGPNTWWNCKKSNIWNKKSIENHLIS